jgi:hypothetical protein
VLDYGFTLQSLITLMLLVVNIAHKDLLLSGLNNHFILSFALIIYQVLPFFVPLVFIMQILSLY